MFERMKSRIPLPVRRAAHKVALDPIGNVVREVRIRRRVRAFREGAPADRAFVEGLSRDWGNAGLSADVTYIEEVLSRVGECASSVLDLGSGLTTLAAALAAERKGLTVWSLEQKKYWAKLVRRRLKQNKLANVELRHAPLKDRGVYVWYDIEGLELPDRFDLVICDGPGVIPKWGDSYALWRYGVLPVLQELGVSVGEVLLDDATEPRGANLLKRWEEDFGMKSEVVRTPDGDYAVVRPPA